MTLFHLHIPKTAGSYVNQYLKSSFGRHFLHENPFLSTVEYNSQQVQEMMSFYAFACYAGHVFNLSNVPLETHARGFSFVRNPIDKFLSFYFFQRGRVEVKDTHPIKKYNLPEYIAYIKDQPENTIATDGSQLTWLLGAKGGGLDTVKKYLDNGRYALFPQERMEQSMYILTQHFAPLEKTPTLVRVNPSKRDQIINEELLDQVKKLPWVEADLQLHQLAEDFLARALAKHEAEFTDWKKAIETIKADNKKVKFSSRVKRRLKRLING